ncbi:CdaR family transcriptional regulator [Paenibacillus rhizophilus]|uniref:Sugar diacid utilization regulator n=1 Tax=Paenibacillus rhizophilus TaxID=1850366 RepID=A0A3N9PRQ6_9BACL|nr:sugar diacid recognition domain-containing protein [Paenibacillus rhizophilus]RQW08992.1 sugar diacid utilization regulator [Paenibacillus rhizophilus]
MHELTRQQAQNIVDKMMQDIPYNINIMDRTGIIIGSGNKGRVGTLHYGAAEAIKQQKIVEITEDEEFVKKGINLPIELNGTIVGVVGISGEVNETWPFGNLVKTTVILLIEQSIALEKENLKSHLKHEFFNLITHSDTNYTKELADQALIYGIQLTKPSQIIYAEFPGEIAEDFIKNIPSFKSSIHSLYLVVQEADKLEALLERIRRQYPDAYLSVSKWNDTISEGYIQTKAALRVLKGVYFNERTIFYAKCEFFADMSKLLKNDTRAERLAHLLEKNDELTKTLQVYLNCNLNANKSAQLLMIHRNTLHYRLTKIHSITGKDPHNILELVELIFMLIHRI